MTKKKSFITLSLGRAANFDVENVGFVGDDDSHDVGVEHRDEDEAERASATAVAEFEGAAASAPVGLRNGRAPVRTKFVRRPRDSTDEQVRAIPRRKIVAATRRSVQRTRQPSLLWYP
jgi:hypothetical protein